MLVYIILHFLLQVMYVQALVFVVLMGKMLRALFFGQLRAAEMEVNTNKCFFLVMINENLKTLL